MKRSSSGLITLLLVVGCAGQPDPESADWRMVLTRKKVLARADESRLADARQSYIDALRDFCRRYPSHARAREVYREMESGFARELFARGQYDEAIRFFESVLRDDPQNVLVRRELARAMSRRFVSHQSLQTLRKGMTQSEVAARLGAPLPGWERTMQKGDSTVLSWYYRKANGQAAGVHFIDGQLFAAEYDAPVQFNP